MKSKDRYLKQDLTQKLAFDIENEKPSSLGHSDFLLLPRFPRRAKVVFRPFLLWFERLLSLATRPAVPPRDRAPEPIKFDTRLSANFSSSCGVLVDSSIDLL